MIPLMPVVSSTVAGSSAGMMEYTGPPVLYTHRRNVFDAGKGCFALGISRYSQIDDQPVFRVARGEIHDFPALIGKLVAHRERTEHLVLAVLAGKYVNRLHHT